MEYARLRDDCKGVGEDLDSRVKARVKEASRLLCGEVKPTPEMYVAMARAVHAECMRGAKELPRRTHGGRPGTAPSERELIEMARDLAMRGKKA